MVKEKEKEISEEKVGGCWAWRRRGALGEKWPAVSGTANSSDQLEGTESGRSDSVCELGRLDHRPQGFETKLGRRWRWSQAGYCYETGRFVMGREVRRKDL